MDASAIDSCASANEEDSLQHTALESIMPEVEVWTTVDVDLDEFDTDDLIEELEKRGRGMEVSSKTGTELITAIYEKRRLGQDYQRELDELIYLGIGKIV